MADFSHPPLFGATARGDALEFLDETYPSKTRGMGSQKLEGWGYRTAKIS